LKNLIWWIDWSGVTIADGATKTFTTTDGLLVTITISAVTGTNVFACRMNAPEDGLLKNLYDFANPAIMPALLAANTMNNSRFTITVKATRNGKAVPFSLIAADAGISSQLEITTFTTSAGNWKTLEFYSNTTPATNPSSGCGTQEISLSGTDGGMPIVATDVVPGESLVMEISLSRSEPGSTAVALGIMAPVNQRNFSLAASYGYAQHQWLYSTDNACNYLPPLPGITSLEALQLGNVTSFADYDGSGNYSVSIPVRNITGRPAYLTGWFDYNRNGAFDTNESATVVIPPDATVAVLNWSSLPAGFITGKVSQYGFRFRISSDQNAVKAATGFAPDGVVSDYLTNITAPCAANINTLANMVLCAGKPTQLNASGGVKYNWSPATGLSADNIPNPVASPTVTTTYKVSGTDEHGCPGSANITLYVNPAPVLTKRRDTAICAGTTLQLSAVSDIPATYTWWPEAAVSDRSIPDPLTSPAVSTRYIATATTIYGCSSQTTINVTVNPAPQFKVIPDTPVVCIGQSVEIVAKGADVFEWYTGRDSLLTTLSKITVAPVRDSIFKIYMEHHTCAVSDTILVPVKVHELPVTTISKSSDIDCAHPEVMLKATGGIYYTWEQAQGISNNLVANPVVSPLKTTTYEVTVMDKYGCYRLESITVNVDVALTFTRFPIPTAFTPNGDGKNDCFGLKSWGATYTFEFSIFNRRGELLFNTHSPGVCWDGTFKGEAQPAGSYIYMVRAKTICGDVLRKGMVVLAR
jgi:gliding motility-associated-like protein